MKVSLLMLAVLLVLTAELNAGDILIESNRFKLVLSSDGFAVSLEEKNTGKSTEASEKGAEESIFIADLIKKGIGVPLKDFDRTGTRSVDLKYMELDDDILLVSAGRDQLPRFTFSVSGKDDYVTFRLIEVEDCVGEEKVRSLHFNLPFGSEVFPLDYTVKKEGSSGIGWPGIWCRNSNNPPGGFALWLPENEVDDDDVFYQIWAHEGLPHPRVDGPWTVERARKWVHDWQEKFSSYRMVYILPEKPEDLKPLADEAERWGMTHVYLHKDIWFKDGYWPDYSDNSSLNPRIFPEGHPDMLEYSRYLKSKGMGLTVRTTSWGIGKNNANYVGKEASREFASWISGSLEKPIDSSSDEIYFRPDADMVYPPSHTPGHMTIKHILIDHEIINYESLVDTDQEVWIFQDCQRGSFGTEPADHSKMAKASGLKMCHGQNFCPDPDKALFNERVKGYSDFMNAMLIDNCNFDALEVYNVIPYGPHKFLGSVYSNIDHPTWSFTSGGFPQWGWFEFQLESTKKLVGFDRPRTIPKRQDLMIGLHQEFWPASGPYDYCYAIAPNAAAGWGYMRLQANKGFHNLTLFEFKEHGLSDHYIKNLKLWEETGPLLSESQKERIYSAYYNRESLFGREGAYPSADELFRIEDGDTDGSRVVVPFCMMKRREGDRPWSYGQEHGLVKPAQYFRPGAEALDLNNPYSAQCPEFIIRVMTDFSRDVYERKNIASGESEEQRAFNDMLDSFLGASAVQIEKQTETDTEVPDQVKFRILPRAEEMENTGSTIFVNEGEGLRITCQNSSPKPYALINFHGDNLPWYKVSTDITGARGLGMMVTGDGNGAVLTVRTSGNGTRDFAVTIDFTGRRYIEIPTPEACWANGSLMWVPAYKRYRNNHITKVSLGFAALPAKTDASVLVEDIRFLPELASDLRNPVIHVGSGTLKVDGVIPTDHYLWYWGGDSLGVYDLNWNLKKTLDVKLEDYKAPTGYHPVRITHDEGNLNPWLETLFFVHDKPMPIK
ncbi:MAG: hypothetical protein GY790_12005 [Bacteroidetes bacterium]|nr:hypothetical protein [Bacteroidota bacterium]